MGGPRLCRVRQDDDDDDDNEDDDHRMSDDNESDAMAWEPGKNMPQRDHLVSRSEAQEF